MAAIYSLHLNIYALMYLPAAYLHQGGNYGVIMGNLDFGAIPFEPVEFMSSIHINMKILVQCFGESLLQLAQYCLGMYFNCLNWYRVECYPEFFQMEVE